MSSKYKKRLTILSIMLVLCGMIEISYLNYENKTPEIQNLVEANGELSINYINGNLINKNGTFEFSITNNSNKDFYYEILMQDLVGYDENLKYSIISKEASININNASLEKENSLLVDNVMIKRKVTENFKLTITNNKKTSFTLVIRKVNENEEYFFNTIIKDNDIQKKPITKPSLEIATNKEGLIEDTDDYGITYYFRGNITNNYVKFADNIWRIVRINGDGTVRLILNDALNELSSYNENTEDFEKYENTTIIKKLDSFYENSLKSNENYIANTKFCTETENTSEGSNKIYNSYTRLVTNNIPSFNCLGETYSSKIGLISADEVAFAGGNFKEDNKEYYLYNKEIDNVWWTSSLAKTKDTTYFPFSVGTNGKISESSSGTSYHNIRPVINIIKKSTVKGSGTLEDPYIINNLL